jgi:hypothetical protein
MELKLEGFIFELPSELSIKSFKVCFNETPNVVSSIPVESSSLCCILVAMFLNYLLRMRENEDFLAFAAFLILLLCLTSFMQSL